MMKKKKRLSKREWLEEQRKKPVTLDEVKRYALYLLERQDYTETKLMQKLTVRFQHNQQFNQEVVDYCREYGYINDKRFAHRYTNSLLQQKMGPSKIRQKLYNKGFSSAVIDHAMTLTAEKDYLSDALLLKQKKYGTQPISDAKEYQRAMGFLVRKGFTFDVATNALKMTEEEAAGYLDALEC